MGRTRKKEGSMSEVTAAGEKLTRMAKSTDDSIFMPNDDAETTKLIELINAERLTKKLKTEFREINNITRQEIRMLVNLYYQMQDVRKAVREQMRAIEGDENNSLNVKILDWILKNTGILEIGIKDTMQIVCENCEEGRWLLQINGIGPVLAAGLLAYFDIEGKQYATQFISYAGLNDNNRPFIGNVGATKIVNEVVGSSKKITDEMVQEIALRTQWPYHYLMENAYNQEKGTWSKSKIIAAASKIPYNANLKKHLWKVGESFHWLCNKPDSLYGRLYTERREYEMKRNEAGELADQAAAILERKNIGKNTEAYKAYSEGKLPKAHINARASRWVQKIFVSHLFEELYRVHNGKIPPRYYILERDPLHNKEVLPEVPYFKVPEDNK